MTPEQYELARRLYAAAIELDSSQRIVFLNAANIDDAEVRSEIESLLEHHDATKEGFLEPPKLPVSSNQTEDDAPDAIGPYHILETLGIGGMGVVYLAQQDHPLRRRVAIKVIKLGMDTKEVLARFEAERQAMALMSHPNIAQVHEAGMTDTGRPYFVMEHVQGLPITEHCNKERIGLVGRLRLFQSICEAIQHAHQKGVIHRDIKPSNVLVEIHGDQSVPKVIDFGVAKAINQRLTEKTLFTEQGHLLGTPAYMSPEQAEMSAQDIDTRSDIYSLGVLLYELLTSVLPFDPATLREAALKEVQRIIREVDPAKPSTRLSSLGQVDSRHVAQHLRLDSGALSRRLRGDLDWIVMKALEKERTRRYATATEFAADIERHLQNKPVEAGPPDVSYRVRKFVQRNRALVTSAAAVFLMLVIGVIASSWQAVRASHAEERAKSAEQRVIKQRDHAIESTRNVILKLSDAIETVPGSTPARHLLLSSAVEYLDQIHKDAMDDVPLQAILVKAYIDLGDTLGGIESGNLGSSNDAKSAYQTALSLLEELQRRSPSDPAATAQLWVIHLRLGNLAFKSGATPDALGQYTTCLQIAEKLAVLSPGDTGSQRRLAVTLLKLGDVSKRSGDFDTARRSYMRSLVTRRRLAELNAKNPKYTRDVATALGRLGDLLVDTGETAEGIKQLREMLALREGLAQEHPDSARYQRDLMITHYLLGHTLLASDNLDGAARHLEKSRELAEQLIESDPTNARAQTDFAGIYQSIASLRENQGDTKQAIAIYRTFGSAARRAADLDPGNGVARRYMAQAHAHIGMLLLEQGQARDAREELLHAEQLYSELLAADPLNINVRVASAEVDGALADVHHNLGEREEALQKIRGALAKLPPESASTEHQRMNELRSELESKLEEYTRAAEKVSLEERSQTARP